MRTETVQISDVNEAAGRKQVPSKEEKLRRFKLILISKRFHPGEIFGGAERFITRLAGKLADLGVDVTALGAGLRKDWKKLEEIETGRGRILIKRLPHPGIRFMGTLSYNFCLFFHLLKQRKKHAVIHVNFASKELMTAAIAKIFTKHPLICRIACAGKTGELHIENRRFYAPLFRRMLRKVDAFVALSDEIASELSGAGVPEKAIVKIPNGIDTDEFHPPGDAERLETRKRFGVGSGETALCFVGRLSRQKGLGSLLEAVGRMQAPIRLLIAGKGPEEKRLKNLSRKLKLENRVVFLGAIGNVKSVYAASDIFVLPSLYEGLSNALLEAMAMGLPCIATDVSGSNELIEHGKSGLIVAPGDSTSLAEAIGILIEDEHLRRSLGHSARRRIEERYSLDSIARAYLKLYLRLLDERA